MSYQSQQSYPENTAEPRIVYVEWHGRTKYTYYDDGIVKITRYKAKKRIYWGRVIAALIVFVLLIMGIVQLIKTAAGLVKNDRSEIKKNTQMPSSSQQDKAESKKDKPEKNSTPEQFAEDEPEEYSDISLKICIDAGHGDYDTGTISTDNLIESEQNLEIAQLVRDYLEECGATVIMTRDEDIQVSLSDRCSMANLEGADFFVSLHRNSSESGYDESGVEIWVNNNQPEYDCTLAQNILYEIASVGITQNRGVQFGYKGLPDQNYQINTDTVMPSCLVELGFITNDNDNALFENYKEEYAKAIGDGIIRTAIELDVIDDDGSRLLGEQLISDGKANVYENY